MHRPATQANTTASHKILIIRPQWQTQCKVALVEYPGTIILLGIEAIVYIKRVFICFMLHYLTYIESRQKYPSTKIHPYITTPITNRKYTQNQKAIISTNRLMEPQLLSIGQL